MRFLMIALACLLLAHTAWSLSEAEVIQAIRDFEGNQSLEVTLENPDEWDAPIPNGHGNRTVYNAVGPQSRGPRGDL